MSKFLALASVAALASGAFMTSPAALATVLAPGDRGSPDALVVSGATLATASGPFASTIDGGCADFCGTYTESVVANTLNTFGSGDLTFVIRVSSDVSSGHSIDTVSASSFGSSATIWMTDVGYEVPLNGGLLPTAVDRGSIVGSAINFDGLGLPAGEITGFLVVDTNAKSFESGHISFIDDGVATVSGYEPATAIPEPSTWALLGLGFAGLAYVRRGARRNSAVV